ncbi:MAG: 2-oxoglutarate dehydrogenase E1 component [Gammaproteobacteria bacterium]|nr:2-oxoglutarate dehydrogenase E1 component [Gammaproteobacteria bacterium]NNM01845.1 2-oxoglutarate dehydrogenase E1 component [Gammaproteobacteria bacterium]
MTMPPPSALFSANAGFIEQLYEDYLSDPASVSDEWRAYFDSLQSDGGARGADTAHSAVRERVKAVAASTRPIKADSVATREVNAEKQVAVLQLINAYRFRGHRRALLDPLEQYDRPDVPELDPAYHGLTDSDLDLTFNTGSLHGPAEATLREILDTVRRTYCSTIGAEYMHINETAQKRWVQQRLEGTLGQPNYDPDRKRQIHSCVVAAASLEQYLHARYVGQKRFSLEGGESAIPFIDQVVESSGRQGVKEIVIGMAHRGRVNVLVNIVGKHPSKLFDEFEGKGMADVRLGDVKYHLGYSSDIETSGGPVHVTLAFNPSHLEIIDPVVEGSVRARQDRRDDKDRNQVLPLLIHGDAAFAGQGVVMETLNLSQTRGYSTGGTVHLIINNQIGFTTSDPLDARSTLYCTDVAKMVQAPIFHVNGDDPEAVVLAAELAMEYRNEFKKDVVVDLVCYRKHGHSEADEPSATQPVMYRHIRNHPGVVKLYTDKLVRDGVIKPGDAESIQDRYISALEQNVVVSRPYAEVMDQRYLINYDPYRSSDWRDPVDTSLTRTRIQRLSERFVQVPEELELHPAVKRILADRAAMATGEKPLDWGYAETLAYASLLEDGYPVRISGQDSGRGTFFHRHAVIHNVANGETWLPLQHISADQAPFLVINSTLSEEAVLAFEYGYASAAPAGLVIWEAQFGDFVNGAQVVIDQFITSSEEKWGRFCGLVMLLPHGYDGAGPEHSSARLERFMQLCAEDNMQVVNPTTPAQMFHLLRRQVLRPYRRPLVVMSPKSLLRHKLSNSSLADISEGGFQPVISEVDDINPLRVRRILICSGKVYYDLLDSRREHKLEDTAIIRLEQLYPFPKAEIEAAVAEYRNADEMVWVQEEPRNQGAWGTLLSTRHLGGCFPSDKPLLCVGRPYSASPAVGYMSLHLEQQRTVVEQALQVGEYAARKTA